MFKNILQATALSTLITLSTAQTPLICEDNISGQAPFKSNAIPCLLGCGTPLAMATGGLLPGSVNETDIPYCELNCVRSEASPAQSSAAPDCNTKCRERNSATPEQLGWCMYWCVQGGEIEDLVVSTTCVPSLEYVPATTRFGTETQVVTYEAFSNPAAWTSWYATQTAIPRTSPFIFGGPSATGDSSATSTTTTTTATRARLFPSTSSATSSPSTMITSSASVTGAPALGEGATSSRLNATVATTTSTSGQASWSSAWPALAIAVLFAVACF